MNKGTQDLMNMDDVECEVCDLWFKAKNVGKDWVYTTEGSAMCRNCGYEWWNTECSKCGCIYSEDDETCPNCEDEEAEGKSLTEKQAKKIIRKIFRSARGK
jgi:RNA polymerase subunit RPABC4/transcription elongation factor Spt4